MQLSELLNKLKTFTGVAKDSALQDKERPPTRPFRPLRSAEDDRTRPSPRINDARWREIQQAIDKAG